MSRITTTTIANRLGLSRGTVSKALNNKDKIDERTRLLVQKTAGELGYKNFKHTIIHADTSLNKTLSILVRDNLLGEPYWAVFIKGFENEAASKNFRYTVNVISTEEEAALLLPKNFIADPPVGIVTIGPISEAYYRRLQSEKIPAVYVDTARNVNDASIFGDTLFVCNKEHVHEITAHLIGQGHTKLGFISIGGADCRSLHERWLGFASALEENGIPILPRFIYGIAEDEVFQNIRPWVTSLKEFPTVFVCANDFIALTAKSALNDMGLDVPGDIALCGFDDDRRLAALYPDLTTVDSYAEYMGKRAMQKLYWRLNNPNEPYEVVRISSKIYYRNSTEGYIFK